MEINGQLKCDLVKLTLAKNKSRDCQTANVDAVTRVDQQSCEAAFGHEFTTAVAFGGMVRRATTDSDGKPDGGEVFVHLTQKPTPTGKLTIQMHKIRMLGRTLDKIQPAVWANGVQGEPKVDVTIRIPVDIGVDKPFDANLIEAFKDNRVVAIEFEPKQGVLDFEAAKRADTDEVD
jgi:hypothetical protein